MIETKRFRGVPGVIRRSAAAAALTLLSTAAGAVTFHNSSGSTMWFYLYNQNDSSALVPCFETQLQTNSQVTLPGFPGSCGLYQKVKVKGVASRSLTEFGATCWGNDMGSGGTARIDGGYDGCTVIITP